MMFKSARIVLEHNKEQNKKESTMHKEKATITVTERGRGKKGHSAGHYYWTYAVHGTLTSRQLICRLLNV